MTLKTSSAAAALISACLCATTASAATLDAGIFGAGGVGTAANPVVINVPLSASSGLFLDTINFDLGDFTHFNMTSTANNIGSFSVPIFENNNDTEAVPAATSFTEQPLADLGLPRDYHLHPAGLITGAGAGYTLNLWGSTPGGGGGNPVPVPAAIWLLGSALAGLGFTGQRRSRPA